MNHVFTILANVRVQYGNDMHLYIHKMTKKPPEILPV